MPVGHSSFQGKETMHQENFSPSDSGDSSVSHSFQFTFLLDSRTYRQSRNHFMRLTSTCNGLHELGLAMDGLLRIQLDTFHCNDCLQYNHYLQYDKIEAEAEAAFGNHAKE
ncbi:hypothetical protein CHS0354_033994 [Potamilus streckersoni]|uniref:Uncharacterized protein n=1 Tax=Potamilus streckersoni TaxID=2493646 RepID=A0AAE0WA19_9BIVA|nr:hypothetical protein CHS0354_033994 [Potamilus streckersoni]